MLDPIRDFPWLRAGYKEGLATGKAASVLAVLAARRLPIEARVRDRIMACQDQVVLDRWIARAATAQSADEVLGDN